MLLCVRPWRYSSEQIKAPGAQVLTSYYRDKQTSRDRYLGPYRQDKGSELTRAVLSRSTSRHNGRGTSGCLETWVLPGVQWEQEGRLRSHARHAGLHWVAVVEKLTPLGLSQSDNTSGRVLRIRSSSAECRWSSTPTRVHLLSSQGGCFRVLLVCRRLFSILRSQIQVVSLGGGNRGGDQYTQAKEWCFSLLFKNSASLPFAKAEAVPLLRLEFIKASNMINNLYTWIVIQKKIRNKS